jgi:hypothetical protein
LPSTPPHPYTLPDLKAARFPRRVLGVLYRSRCVESWIGVSPAPGRGGAYRPGEVRVFPDV